MRGPDFIESLKNRRRVDEESGAVLRFNHPRGFAEVAFERHAIAKDWIAHRSGWPDYLVQHEGVFIGVEVKSKHDRLHKNQIKMFPILEAAGIEIFVWRPDRSNELIPWRDDWKAMS